LAKKSRCSGVFMKIAPTYQITSNAATTIVTGRMLFMPPVLPSPAAREKVASRSEVG